MKKLLLITLLLSTTAFAAIPKYYTVTCKHFAGTDVLDNLTIGYTSQNGQWLNEAKVTIDSDESIMTNGSRVGRINDNALNDYIPEDSEVYFEGCVDCDYDAARINFVHDDVLGQMAVLEYVSDGPAFTQFLQCTSKED